MNNKLKACFEILKGHKRESMREKRKRERQGCRHQTEQPVHLVLPKISFDIIKHEECHEKNQ